MYSREAPTSASPLPWPPHFAGKCGLDVNKTRKPQDLLNHKG